MEISGTFKGEMALLVWIFIVTACISLATCEDEERYPERGRKILVFGGNGFLGSATVDKFMKNGDNITIVNRGNWYWDSFNRIKTYVNHISCDRTDGVESCDDLVKLVNGVESFDAVIDFSAFDEKDTKDSGALLKGKVKLYILISTDSIYDVCEKGHDDKTKETDDNRSDDGEQSVRLAIVHDYGHRKKRAEEELLNHHHAEGFPIVILRLPDVIGPRDTTYRWWIYQLWIKVAHLMPMKTVSTPEFLRDYQMSLVYSEDVAKLIFDLLMMDEDVYNQVYNIAFDETLTLQEILRIIQKELQIEELEIIEEKNHTETMYPSVRRGPIDITKAKEKLHWSPTSFTDAAAEVVKFYEDAIKGDIFEMQVDEIIQTVALHLYPDVKTKFYMALEKIYDINLNHFLPKDEL